MAAFVDLAPALHWVEVHWLGLTFAALAALLLFAFYRDAATNFGPQDRSGNGIVLGRAKTFDNRSLALMLEQLDASLRAFNVISSSVVQTLGAFQAQRSTKIERSVKVSGMFGQAPASGAAKDGSEKADTAADDKDPATTPEKTAKDPGAGKLPSDFAPSFGVAAGDALTDQMNLAYQILNLRMLNERSLSDRLINDHPRLQVVLGFQISIIPPKGKKDCAAVVEIGLKQVDSTDPVSIVALIPQEKTYNAATLSSKADSLDGSVVSGVIKAGVAGARKEQNLFVHRDADTIAFEHFPDWKAGAFGLIKNETKPSPTVFGWEFRPVLGRRSVSPGIRQMLVVIALPQADRGAAATNLEIRARSYWRRYERKNQTTSLYLGWWPFILNGPKEIENQTYSIALLPTLQIQERLEPKITKLSWAEAGSGSAVVLIEGQNFFSGTKIIIGGVSYSGGDDLVFKSDRALELHTTIDALADGDAILSGRFGRSAPLRPAGDLPGAGLNIVNVSSTLREGDQYSRLCLTIAAAEPGGSLTIAMLKTLPEPIIYLNGAHLPFPYDYIEEREGPAPAEGQKDTRVCKLKVQAWAPASMLRGKAMFKVPFCGSDWASSVAIPGSTPTILRLGGDPDETLVIAAPMSLVGDWVATLDTDYALGASPRFQRLTDRQLSLKLPAKLLSKFDRLQLRLGDKIGYVLDIPPTSATIQGAALDTSQPPPTLQKNRSAVVDLQGTKLTDIESATLGGNVPIQAYADGTRLRLFLTAAQTANEGKAVIILKTRDGVLKEAPIYVVDASSDADPQKPAAPAA